MGRVGATEDGRRIDVQCPQPSPRGRLRPERVRELDSERIRDDLQSVPWLLEGRRGFQTNQKTKANIQMSAQKTRVRKPKIVQANFTGEGMEAVTIKDIDDCAERYVDARDERITAQEPEKKEKALLMALMKKHEQTVYKTEAGKIVKLVHRDETVKVVSAEDEDGLDVDED